jgi:hypothetical protein
MTGRIPVIGPMLGDMTGIGPEISAKLLAAGKYRSDSRRCKLRRGSPRLACTRPAGQPVQCHIMRT